MVYLLGRLPNKIAEDIAVSLPHVGLGIQTA
jgi:hypothetical protein